MVCVSTVIQRETVLPTSQPHEIIRPAILLLPGPSGRLCRGDRSRCQDCRTRRQPTKASQPSATGLITFPPVWNLHNLLFVITAVPEMLGAGP
ncbi:uncharacterized protein BO80DRAFT_430139 [Aspergillus ibericus CBS 121593]|uniref:Uncharacterized protein n=1 Tax=Aspergillus ibericus CBS 121593 TaxID=1448316 RepID=A0A395GI86_9EURO|nr:hypothetical protein BO80DRAFT_430139 [Aspergillus ibericus CBS 121593]RAK95140.1 hypothetical protein BO80DRAFT_430139 [Aspergillus ibericus CBS 121593]